jgi:TolB-like protein
MAIRANVILTTSNTQVFLGNAVGIAAEDVVTSEAILRNRNIRVVSANTISNVVTLNSSVNVFNGNTLNFTTLVSGTGLSSSESRAAFFLRSSPAYPPMTDPRLPKHITNTQDFLANSSALVLNDLSNVEVVTFNSSVTAARANNEIVVENAGLAQITDYVLSGRARFSTNLRVRSIDLANNVVRLSGQLVSTNGQTVYFQRAQRPLLRIGSEVIYYSNVDIETSSVTGIVRNLANTRPAADYVWAAGNSVSILGTALL